MLREQMSFECANIFASQEKVSVIQSPIVSIHILGFYCDDQG
jgi:hypothetical protein